MIPINLCVCLQLVGSINYISKNGTIETTQWGLTNKLNHLLIKFFIHHHNNNYMHHMHYMHSSCFSPIAITKSLPHSTVNFYWLLGVFYVIFVTQLLSNFCLYKLLVLTGYIYGSNNLVKKLYSKVYVVGNKSEHKPR